MKSNAAVCLFFIAYDKRYKYYLQITLFNKQYKHYLHYQISNTNTIYIIK